MTEDITAWDDARIREAFIYDGGESEYHDPINGARDQRRIAGAIFDAWLAKHDAGLLARAEAAEAKITAALAWLSATDDFDRQSRKGYEIAIRNAVRALSDTPPTTEESEKR